MVRFVEGNILEADTQALVNTVNCVGVMGKGIALQFKKAFPAYFKDYERAVNRGEVRPGRLHVYRTGALQGPQYIISFPTKEHWRAKSKLEHIESGLVALRATIRELSIRTVAVPPLGCGSGGLMWSSVMPRIAEALGEIADADVLVYEPRGAPTEPLTITSERPAMTRAIAILLVVFDHYRKPGYELTLLEAQKLAYFCYLAGELQRLRFRRDRFGPYAPQLNNILERMEGHFTRGYRGDRSVRASISIKEEAVQEARRFLGEDKDLFERLSSVEELIDGFETPYGMELLASVLWVAGENNDAADDPDAAVKRTHAWSRRKAKIMNAEHIVIAWQRLKNQGWLP